MRSILVTGGAGYIGSHVAKALASKGYVPVTLDNLSLGHAEAVKWGPFFEGDVGDPTLLREIFQTHSIEGVIHLAALSNVRESFEIPLTYYQNNVSNALAVLQVIQEFGPLPFVFSSTCAVYGIPKRLPLVETHVKDPISPYGESKLMVEKILESAHHAHALPLAILRYFNAGGADPEGAIGENHSPETHLLPLLIQTALGKRKTFSLFGQDHETPDGTPIRDFIHVTDLAEAHLLALEALIEGKKMLTLNLGSGVGYSVQEMIDAVEAYGGKPINLQVEERFHGDPPILIADPSQGKEVLGWAPRYSDLKTLIDTAWRWQNT